MKVSIAGTRPTGAPNEREASRWVRDMFGRVASRYDLANHLLSANIDRSWRKRAVYKVADVLHRPEARILDLCCGTGDLTLALAQKRGGPIYGSDFCHPMLAAAVPKFAADRLPCPVFEADALSLPLADAAFDLITCAFGFRNLANYDAGLREFRRVLRPGGKLAILEFSQPPNQIFAALYGVYSRRVLPWIGGLLSGAPDAYNYLPESVVNFPGASELASRMASAGFARVAFERLTFGIVALHTGSVPD